MEEWRNDRAAKSHRSISVQSDSDADAVSSFAFCVAPLATRIVRSIARFGGGGVEFEPQKISRRLAAV